MTPALQALIEEAENTPARDDRSAWYLALHVLPQLAAEAKRVGEELDAWKNGSFVAADIHHQLRLEIAALKKRLGE